MKLRAIFVGMVCLCATPVHAQTTSTTNETTTSEETRRQTNEEAVIGKLRFGLGVGAVMDVGSIDRIGEAQLVNGVVRVTSDANNTIRPIFETHMFAWSLSEQIVVGPFVGVELDSGSVVNAIGVGLMTGIRVNKDQQTLNFGLGAFLDPSVRTLGNGIVEDMPLPPGETEIRYRNRSQWGVLFMTSFGF